MHILKGIRLVKFSATRRHTNPHSAKRLEYTNMDVIVPCINQTDSQICLQRYNVFLICARKFIKKCKKSDVFLGNLSRLSKKETSFCNAFQFLSHFVRTLLGAFSYGWALRGVFIEYSRSIHMYRLCIGYVSVMYR